ncbi:hypothetical protein ACIPCA_12565 [Flavobacterium covae]|uniref:Uncharacterized protein n=1 Tax=Flavobacterium davisii TaxID=2906077 RepID=A0A246GGT1_9FLAO|nr:hypothetical protein [Flavobacterium davisii]OWP82729.1 hypothetical protein BWK59_14305 [Flavobacterium davisii]
MTRSEKATEIERICKMVIKTSTDSRNKIIKLSKQLNITIAKGKDNELINSLELERNTLKKQLFEQTKSLIQTECNKHGICPKFVNTIIYSK